MQITLQLNKVEMKKIEKLIKIFEKATTSKKKEIIPSYYQLDLHNNICNGGCRNCIFSIIFKYLPMVNMNFHEPNCKSVYRFATDRHIEINYIDKKCNFIYPFETSKDARDFRDKIARLLRKVYLGRPI